MLLLGFVRKSININVFMMYAVYRHYCDYNINVWCFVFFWGYNLCLWLLEIIIASYAYCINHANLDIWTFCAHQMHSNDIFSYMYLRSKKMQVFSSQNEVVFERKKEEGYLQERSWKLNNLVTLVKQYNNHHGCDFSHLKWRTKYIGYCLSMKLYNEVRLYL